MDARSLERHDARDVMISVVLIVASADGEWTRSCNQRCILRDGTQLRVCSSWTSQTFKPQCLYELRFANAIAVQHGVSVDALDAERARDCSV